MLAIHSQARTTPAVRAEIARSPESSGVIAKRYGVNPKTVAKWKKRTSTADHKTGPIEPKSTVLSVEDEAVIVAVRHHTLLPLDDCLYALQPTIPRLTRSSLHRCLQRHGISRLPDIEGDKPCQEEVQALPDSLPGRRCAASLRGGYFHVDIAGVRTAEGKLSLFTAIDRTSKFAFGQLHLSTGKMEAAQFLRDLVAAAPYAIHTVLTEFGRSEIDLVNRFPESGQAERMNRTIKDATVKRFHYDGHAQLQRHLADFLDACNFARRLKTLKGLTPFEFICKQGTAEPERFKLNPLQQMPGLNT